MTIPSISVIICTLNRPDDMAVTLKSVGGQELLPQELIVVDQSEDDRTERAVRDFRAGAGSRIARVEYLRQKEKSLVKARNAGIDRARGDIVSFLDDDVRLFSDYYRRVADYMAACPEVGAVSGNVLMKTPMGWKWELRKLLLRLFLLSNFDGRMTASGFGYPVYERRIDTDMAVEMLPGCNMNYRSEFTRRHRFDEWFTGYSYREDADYSYRVSRETQMRMIPYPRLYHYYSPRQRLTSRKKKEMEIRNCFHVFKKFKKSPLVTPLFIYSLIGLIVIDFFEFFLHWDFERFEVFRISLLSTLGLLKPGGRAEVE